MSVRPKFTVGRFGGRHSRIVLHPETAEELEMDRLARTHVIFGTARHHAFMEFDSSLSRREVQLSSNLLEALRIPLFPRYEVVRDGRGVAIGPCVGLLLYRRHQDITRQVLEGTTRYITRREGRVTKRTHLGLRVYTYCYDAIGGAIFLFALDRVDRETRTLEGYCYDPDADRWRAGRYHYPRAMYRRIGLTPEWKNHFLTVMGDTVFNDYFMDKWEMFEWLRDDPDVSDLLPETRLYEGVADLVTMVARHGGAFLKPVAGMGGGRAIRVRERGKVLSISFSRDGEPVEHTFLPQDPALAGALDQFMSQRAFLVQQPLQLVTWEARVVDFRVLMQKDDAARWFCQGIVVRAGPRRSVVSNISSGGEAFTLQELFGDRLGWELKEVFQLSERLKATAVRVGHALDRLGLNYGTAGVDLGLDSSGRLWLIELNVRDPDATIALDVEDTSLYFSVKQTLLLYAKALAGFGVPSTPARW